MKFPATALIAAFASKADLGNHHLQHRAEQNVRSVAPLRLALLPDAHVMNNRNANIAPTVINVEGAKSSYVSKNSGGGILSNNNQKLHQDVMQWVQETVGVPPAFAAETGPPTKDEINTLREAFAAFYGASRDATAAEQLLTQSIDAWQRQPPDEQAGLYRVRGDCYMVRFICLDDSNNRDIVVDQYHACIMMEVTQLAYYLRFVYVHIIFRH
jgi:hypothetical protein